MTIVLEIANLVIQPGSLALIASATTATTAVLNRVDANNKRKSEIRSRLYTIDRALTTGFAALMKLGSMLDQFQFLDQERRLGGAPIRGFKNSKDLRDTHNECRDAVKEARDAFMDLSEFLPNIHAETVDTAIRRFGLSIQKDSSWGVLMAHF
ncbi:MAG: hypothetical protein HC936_05945 [Leptolyngbyaceae cyanobacterium SU_3_3]|nr:hypothetical protein [Leptolyngbyaceae cyanobacterium SU_3_3]